MLERYWAASTQPGARDSQRQRTACIWLTCTITSDESSTLYSSPQIRFDWPFSYARSSTCSGEGMPEQLALRAWYGLNASDVHDAGTVCYGSDGRPVKGLANQHGGGLAARKKLRRPPPLTPSFMSCSSPPGATVASSNLQINEESCVSVFATVHEVGAVHDTTPTPTRMPPPPPNTTQHQRRQGSLLFVLVVRCLRHLLQALDSKLWPLALLARPEGVRKGLGC